MTWNPFTLRKQLKASEDLNKKLHSQNLQLSLNNGLLKKENERLRAESSRLKRSGKPIKRYFYRLYGKTEKSLGTNFNLACLEAIKLNLEREPKGKPLDIGAHMKLIAHQGDTLDSLIFRHYGRTANLVELALELNPHLANQPILTIGQVVEMPEINQQPQQATKATVQLWD